ncbi:MAG: pitrilysin family protein [Candidatus Aminicenantes bacterium]|nr:pitrilysin family protein [Candidatus Aminicenantes bacterium]
MKKQIYVLILLIMFNISLSAEFDFSKIKNRVSEFTLPNGLKFILLEDHAVPIASFVAYANVGASDERIGIYGISHFLEHMAFKGTSEIGTTDPQAEKKLFTQMDGIFEKILAQQNSINPDQEKIKQWTDELEKLKKEADKYVVTNEFTSILERNGGSGLNAGTSMDSTVYFFSLPSNRLELWAYLESTRFKDPVFREFYKEREVIREERRVRVDNSPLGKLIAEELLALAFKVHPYGIGPIGPMSNIENIRRTDMMEYFKNNYTASNMVIGVAGDVYPDQLKELAYKYFSKLQPGRRNPWLFTVEPKQLGEKLMTIYEDSQPWLVIGYHCPSIRDEDFIKFSVLDNILTSGRSSRLNKKMVTKDKSALFIVSFAGFPGVKYPALFIIATGPNQEHTNKELEEAINKEIEDLKKNPVSEEELNSAKTRFKANTLQRMNSDRLFLGAMLQSEVMRGSWEKAFDGLNAVEKITTGDIQDLVKKYLTENNRVIAKIEKKEDKKEEKKEEVKK